MTTMVQEKPRKPLRKSGIVVPHTTRTQRAAAFLIYLFVRGVTATMRYHWQDNSGFFKNPPAAQAIYCIWHNRLGLSMAAYTGYIRRRTNGRRLAALVSASKDGGLLASILRCFGVQAVRGSSSRRGPQALLELTTWAERGHDLSITPDGPRGPCYVVQHGIMSLAQVTGLPIVPVSFRSHWKIRLKSWDRFQIPIPFSRCEMIFEKPICVPRDASDEEREALRLQLQNLLRSISNDD